MEPKLEIRKLHPSSASELVRILEYNHSWKKLMSLIPETLAKDSFVCDISSNNPPKYISEHISTIENASSEMQSPCTEILFNEWGTSGQVRPALGHLLYLLAKAELFRAVEYVAVVLLRTSPPARPRDGPAALVSTTLPEENSSNGIEGIVSNFRYPFSDNRLANSPNSPTRVIPRIIVTEDNSRRPLANSATQDSNRTPLSNSSSEQAQSNRGGDRQNAIDSNNDRGSDRRCLIDSSSDETGTNRTATFSNGDLIKFSSSSVPNDDNGPIPQISALLEESTNDRNNVSYQTNSYQSNSEIPALSALNLPIGESDGNIPQLDALMRSQSEDQSQLLPNLSILQSSGLSKSVDAVCASELSTSGESRSSALLLTRSNSISFENELVPNLSALNVTPSKQEKISFKENIINERSKELLASGSLPHLSCLLLDKSSGSFSKSSLFIPVLDSDLRLQSGTSSETSKSSLQSVMSKGLNSSRNQCVSPLPNLSLNTKLPHFTYQQLEEATNNFDRTLHQMSCNCEEDLTNSKGRFLGSGAFGSVFLGLSLLDRPIAVKKLFLDNENVVNIDDLVTKQFKNEVEVLSKYQHENLLSLLGYSCDGPTYCLLYEYIPGGTLKDRLQNTEDRLMWTDRLYIAMGTARAITYLHTAYSTPLIHRDIKTANILLDCSNKPKLCDFGIIKLVPNQNTNTATTVLGTSAYMAPEANRGDISIKLDTFSFGVVLLELLTSLPPFDENREGFDIVTHFEEVCENNDISPLLDKNAGTWMAKNINFAEKLYTIANKCLLEKKHRPTMDQISKELSELIMEIK